MRRVRPLDLAKHRYTPGNTSLRRRLDPRQTNLAFEMLCNAFPTGAMVLDSSCRVIFSNREGLNLLQRWCGGPRALAKPGHRSRWVVPADIIGACEQLKQGSPRDGTRRLRPNFGGRVFLRHTRIQNLSAVVALERSPRDRRVAVFCVLIQDRLKENLVAGRKDQLAMLTMAERRVAKLVAEGLRNGEIAAALGKSVTTVKSQLGAVFAKLQIRTRTQLATRLRAA